MKPTFETQSIHLQGVINAREMGGYVIGEKKIKKGVLMRGGSLAGATDEDITRLRGVYGLTNIFDFRTEGELLLAPDRPIAGVQNMWLPAIDPDTEKMADRSLPKDAYRHLEDFVVEYGNLPIVQSIAHRIYSDMVRNEYTQLQYAAFLQTMVSKPQGCFYWHCSQGKDRTGLGAAFILAALGASKELILEDFGISNEFYFDTVKELDAKVLAKGGTEEHLAVVHTFIGVNVEYFREALEIIDSEFGGMESYLKNQLILSDDDMALMRDNFLE